MELSLIGHSCFKIRTKDATLVIDPYNPKSVGYKLPKLSADILLISHEHDDHNYREGVVDYTLEISSPGEYEKSGIYVLGMETFHDDQKGALRGRNTVFYINADGFNLLHLGDLGHELPQEVLERLPDIDVLMIPVGGVYTINASVASKVVSSIEPGIVIPMHFQTADLTLPEKLDGVEKFLDEMIGDDKPIQEDKLKLSSKSGVSEETEVVVLKPQH